MPISRLQNGLHNHKLSTSKPSTTSPAISDFQKILREQHKNNSTSEPDRQSSPVKSGSGINKAADHTIHLGVITKKNPTVSDLLINNPSLKRDAWNIIFSDINTNKPFKKIRPGTEVDLDLATNEILWHNPGKKGSVIDKEVLSKQDHTPDGRIIIGEISENTPTVSHLLRRNQIYHDNAWNIILSAINKDKPYTSLRNGTTVAIDPQTFELSFLNDSPKKTANKHLISSAMADNFITANQPFSQNLVDSVRSYIGRSYDQIDCYGLLVRALRGQGIRYNGHGGLRESLEQMAKQHNLPLNAFQNGEGLIKTAGKNIYAKSFTHINQPDSMARQTFSEIRPSLHEGMILSFSTPSRGHTGIVARNNGEWTYINSGLIDHEVDSGRISRGVGEESLKDEIYDWFNLAKDRKESLQVSMGMLDENKLRMINKTAAITVLSQKKL